MGGWLKFLFWLFGIAGGVLGVLYAFFFDVWTIPLDDPMLVVSVEPTLSAGDVVVVTRRMGEVQRANMLRCVDPQEPRRFVVARAYAAFGDRFEISGEIPAVDGRHVPSPRACDASSVTLTNPMTNEAEELGCAIEEYAGTTYETMRARVRPEPPTKPPTMEPGRWYLVSDNRHMHLDSRDYGQIDPTTCQHVVFRLASKAGFGDTKRRLSVIW